MEIVQPGFFEKLNNWIKESITIKLMSIGFLVIILLIPSAWISSIMEERQQRAGEVIDEVSEMSISVAIARFEGSFFYL